MFHNTAAQWMFTQKQLMNRSLLFLKHMLTPGSEFSCSVWRRLVICHPSVPLHKKTATCKYSCVLLADCVTAHKRSLCFAFYSLSFIPLVFYLPTSICFSCSPSSACSEEPDWDFNPCPGASAVIYHDWIFKKWKHLLNHFSFLQNVQRP